ncbi:AAA family ATPase [Thermodesulfobacteriota bacterium]
MGNFVLANELENYIPEPRDRITGFTAAELMVMELPPPRWAIPDILPEGLNILAGKPKMGKSIMSLNIAIAISTGGKALGAIRVEKGSVLCLALEDTKRRLQKRMGAMLNGADPPDNLYLETEWPKMDAGGIEKLEKRIQKIPDIRLVVIDTFKKIRPIQKGRNINSYDVDYEHISDIKKLADDNGVCILVIHHLRKTESEDIMDDFSGTFGLTGAADGLLAFKRRTGQADAELHIVGRDVDAAEYALKYHPDIWTWELIGDAQEVKSTETRQQIYDAVKDADEPVTPKEISNITGVKYRTVNAGLKALIDEGSIRKTGQHGKYRISAYL